MALARLSVSFILLACPLIMTAHPDPQQAIEKPSDKDSDEAEEKRPISQPPAHHVPTLKGLPRDILSDQEFVWLRPFRLERKDVPWAAGIIGTTAGLIAIDRRVVQNLAESSPGSGFAFSRRVGQAGGLLPQLGVCSTFYLLGRWRGDERSRATGLLSMQAVVSSMVVVGVLKIATQRPRPASALGTTLNHNADGEFFTGGSAFPSGHAAGVWALASVISTQYHEHRWVPPTAYGLAGLVAVSRVTRRKHFPSDVFVGALLGYLIGRHISHDASTESTNTTGRLRLFPQLTWRGGTSLMFAWQF